MKNILFVGPYRQKDDWGASARDYIKAILTNTNISLSTRPIYYTNHTQHDIDKDIVACEKVYFDKYDTIIQHGVFPSFNINTLSKNIGILNIEFSSGESVLNTMILNKLDEIYVSTENEKKAILGMGVRKPIGVVPRPIDAAALISQTKNAIKFNVPSLFESYFKFYCFCDTDNRDNLEAIVTAFHLAFDHQDRVALIISPKIAKTGTHNKTNIEKLCDNIKQKLRINTVYKNEIILPVSNIEAEIGIHHLGDCLINISSGCNYDTSVLLGMSLGKTPIVLNNTGLDYSIDGEKSGFVVKSENCPIIMDSSPLSPDYDLFNAKYFWRKPNIQNFIEVLRKTYHVHKNDKTAIKNKHDYGSKKISDFTYTSIGKLICP